MNRFIEMLQQALDHEPAGLKDDGTALYAWLREEVQRVVEMAEAEPPPDGKEAEELRKGVELLIEKYLPVPLVDDPDELADALYELQQLLDRVDARDSLSHLERLDAYKPFFQVQVKCRDCRFWSAPDQCRRFEDVPVWCGTDFCSKFKQPGEVPAASATGTAGPPGQR